MTAADPWAKHRSGPIFVSMVHLTDIPGAVFQPDWLPFRDEHDPNGHWLMTLRIEWTGTEEEFEQYRSERHDA